ncbi:putative RNA-binding protein (virulence factor B family) [Lactobacillus colini]|uniref:RNA-binding protein (Virulence factor B family) n=1 Tax=Lactobacillus colini TaxID=1819254 RepID=A0ABS4ME61_9LACO|nr:S1-like domain-containing RNA-binding protein [Lactobacillus colini]MBP2057975.1 putative RNA-binding protein (virulence factor B family) [Lactobacillus colini]
MLGEITKGTVTDENSQSYYVQVTGVTFELKKIEVTQDDPIELGSIVQGFIYENKDRKKEMTQFYPFAQKDQYGWGTVTEVRRDLGVFVDIGLNDKDVVVSLDDLPEDKNQWPKRDDRLLVRLETDEKDRIWAKMAGEDVFEQLAANFPNNLKNKNLVGTVYNNYEVGSFVLTDQYYLAFVHKSQMYRPLRLGEKIKARVIGVSQYGRLNLSVLPRSFEEIDDDAQMILMSLRREHTHTLPFYDKSDAMDIKDHFGISKSAFKRAIGRLLKETLITEDKNAGTISLIEEDNE